MTFPPLWGKTWREIGIDAFTNHHTQGISAFLGSSFFHRPIALVSENGEKINPALLAQPLRNLAGDAAGARPRTVPDRSARKTRFSAPF